MTSVVQLAVLLSVLGIHAQGAAPGVLVAGYDSDNVVEFDLGTGRWSELVQCPAGSQPRGLAVGNTGDIYIGFHGGNQNIAQLVPGKDGTEIRDVTKAIGRFGPGFMAFGAGRLWLAGDTDRVIYQVNPASGEVSPSSEYRNPNNIVGLASDGESLYAAEYFQRSVLRFDLRTGLTNAHRLVTNSPHLNRPVGMTIGHNGNLYVANSLSPTGCGVRHQDRRVRPHARGLGCGWTRRHSRSGLCPGSGPLLFRVRQRRV